MKITRPVEPGYYLDEDGKLVRYTQLVYQGRDAWRRLASDIFSWLCMLWVLGIAAWIVYDLFLKGH